MTRALPGRTDHVVVASAGLADRTSRRRRGNAATRTRPGCTANLPEPPGLPETGPPADAMPPAPPCGEGTP